MIVLRVRTRNTLVEVAPLVIRGAAAAGLPSPAHVIAELMRDVAADTVGIFVGLAGDDAQALVVGHLPTSAFHLAPTISLAYSERIDRALSLEMQRRLREWIMAAGFDHALTNNLLHTDRSFLRGFRHFGAGRTIGSAVRFDLGGLR